MKELDYIRYERCETRDWYRVFAGKDGEEFELKGNWHYGMQDRILSYNGEEYKFKEFLNPEIMWDYIDLFGDEDDINESTNNNNKDNESYMAFIYILLIICLALAIFL